MTISQAVALRVDKLLKEKKMTQYRLSMESGVAQSSISEIRKCKNRAPNLYVITELALGFGITVKEFFDDEVFENVID